MKNTRIIIKQLFYSFLIIVFFCQCKKEVPVSELQVAYFEINYENYAWGYDFDGLFIDSDGQVLTYNNPENTWSLNKKKSQISEADLLDNMSQATYSNFTISAEELQEAIVDIPSLGTNFSKERSVGADMGRITAWAYRLKNNGKYERILLKLCGDFEQKNKNKTAIQLVKWLENNLEGKYLGCY